MTLMRTWIALLLAVGVVGAAAGQRPAARDWPHWRGPNRNGVVAEDSGWEAGAWPPKDPLWSAKLGIGDSSTIIAGGRLYTMGWTTNQENVYCLDAKTGRELWKTSYASPRYGRHAIGDQSFYAGPSATPEYDPATGLLYTLGIDGSLNCWDTRKNGQKLWGFNLYERYGVGRRPQATKRAGTLRDYGYTCAPFAYGRGVVVEVGDDEGTLMCFSQRTGQRLWASEAKGPAGHAAAMSPITVQNVPCVAVFTLKGLLVTRLDPGNEGKTVAEYEWLTDFANNIPTLAVEGDTVLITSNYNHRTIAKLRITLKGATKLWEQDYSSGVCSPVIYQGHVYFAQRGLVCLDFGTGELKWDGGKFGSVTSCVATADGRLIVWSNAGDLALVETARRSPNAFKQLAARTGLFRTEVWPHVAVADGRVYCKARDGNLICFSLRGR